MLFIEFFILAQIMIDLLYNITVYISSGILKLVSSFNPKINLFLKGRKGVFSLLQKSISKSDQVIWFHCASLGEFEQGRPIIEKIKKENPTVKILLTFFSPSGYEIRKNYEFADVVTYLPLDTKQNAKTFIQIVNPAIAVFVKYEFWPNILKELKKNNTITILVSGIFRKDQAFFKNYGGWMRKSLTTFSQFFVQNKLSKNLLNSIKFKNVTICGDTRFDRVFEITNQNNQLNFIESFKNNAFILVAGSTWSEDENLLVNYINKFASANEKFIIAPHNMDTEKITKLKNSIQLKTVLYSEKENKKLVDYQVFIVDTIGILTKIYSYADVALIGGGFTKNGIHNILEAATFGVPIIIGPNYKKFNEAVTLVDKKGCKVVTNKTDLANYLNLLKKNDNLRHDIGKINYSYIKENIGATNTITKYINNIIDN